MISYANFLIVFLGIPITILVVLNARDAWRGRNVPGPLRNVPFWLAIAGHVTIAVLYTTPWDNYLVATGVWYYDPALVIGITLGWVPIEEYTFFVLQSVLVGLWSLWLAKRVPLGERETISLHWQTRFFPLVFLGAAWAWAIWALITRFDEGTYLALILIWALPPVGLQLFFGGDILWRYRRLVLLAMGVPTVYLALADILAIGGGTWTIDPQQSLPLFLFGILPVEELVFFLATNTLLVFGIVLVTAVASRPRLPSRIIGKTPQSKQPS